MMRLLRPSHIGILLLNVRHTRDGDQYSDRFLAVSGAAALKTGSNHASHRVRSAFEPVFASHLPKALSTACRSCANEALGGRTQLRGSIWRSWNSESFAAPSEPSQTVPHAIHRCRCTG